LYVAGILSLEKLNKIIGCRIWFLSYQHFYLWFLSIMTAKTNQISLWD